MSNFQPFLLSLSCTLTQTLGSGIYGSGLDCLVTAVRTQGGSAAWLRKITQNIGRPSASATQATVPKLASGDMAEYEGNDDHSPSISTKKPVGFAVQ